MAVLSTADRDRIWRAIMREWSRLRTEETAFSKQVLRDAVDDTDVWIENNQGSFNSALNATFRTDASQLQKTLLFCYVAMKRAGLVTGEED